MKPSLWAGHISPCLNRCAKGFLLYNHFFTTVVTGFVTAALYNKNGQKQIADEEPTARKQKQWKQKKIRKKRQPLSFRYSIGKTPPGRARLYGRKKTSENHSGASLS